ncbi:MAG: helix-turn-helix transcriptional regulator [Planctomycetota bacterium]
MATSFNDELRQAIRESGLTGYKLAKGMGVSQSVISRFLRGAGLAAHNLDLVAAYLDLHVVRGGRHKRR